MRKYTYINKRSKSCSTTTRSLYKYLALATRTCKSKVDDSPGEKQTASSNYLLRSTLDFLFCSQLFLRRVRGDKFRSNNMATPEERITVHHIYLDSKVPHLQQTSCFVRLRIRESEFVTEKH